MDSNMDGIEMQFHLAKAQQKKQVHIYFVNLRFIMVKCRIANYAHGSYI
jgi:hypothetical protein